MPLDGLTPWQPSGWTIRIGPTPALLNQSRHWSQRKRRVFHWLALDAAYAAIDAIQAGCLHKRRDDRWHGGSWIRYFFRVDYREKRTILITISHFHFLGPDAPPDGPHAGAAPLPVDVLVLYVSGSGRRYRIDRIEGIARLPRPPARNRIVSVPHEVSLGGGTVGYLDVAGRPEPAGRMGTGRVFVSGNGHAIYYSPRGLSGIGMGAGDNASPDQREPVAGPPATGLVARIRRALPGLLGGGKANGGSQVGSDRTGGPAKGAGKYAIVQRDASSWPGTVARTRLQLQNHPRRPE